MDQRPGRRGEEGGLQGQGWGDPHAGSSLRPAASRLPPGSSRTLRTLQRHSRGTWGPSSLESALSPRLLGNRVPTPNPKEVPQGDGECPALPGSIAASDGPPRSRPGSHVPVSTPAGAAPSSAALLVPLRQFRRLLRGGRGGSPPYSNPPGPRGSRISRNLRVPLENLARKFSDRLCVCVICGTRGGE